MSHAPQTPKRFTPDHQQTNLAPAAQPQLETSARGQDKVILGPAGEVLVRHSDRPFLGLHQHYKGLEEGGDARRRPKTDTWKEIATAFGKATTVDELDAAARIARHFLSEADRDALRPMYLEAKTALEAKP